MQFIFQHFSSDTARDGYINLFYCNIMHYLMQQQKCNKILAYHSTVSTPTLNSTEFTCLCDNMFVNSQEVTAPVPIAN